EEDFNAHPAEPCDVRGGRVENISGDMALKTRVVDRNPGPGPEYLMKNSNAESSGKPQRVQYWEMVLHGKSPFNETKAVATMVVENTEAVQQGGEARHIAPPNFTVHRLSSLTQVTHLLPSFKKARAESLARRLEVLRLAAAASSSHEGQIGLL